MLSQSYFVFLALLVSAKSAQQYNVTVVTDPCIGPFRIRNTVNFFCLVDPQPPEPVTYQWNYLSSGYGSGSSSSQNISNTAYEDSLRFGWYYCEVFSNSSLVGVGKKLVEYHGYIYPDGPLAHTYVLGEIVILRVNISTSYYARYIKTLTWYHNGTQINATERISILKNDTELVIDNLISSDAGTYQVKVTALTYNDTYCDAIWLPPLTDTHAVLAPVTFVLQEFAFQGKTLQYEPLVALPRRHAHYYLQEGNDQLLVHEHFLQINEVLLTALRDYSSNNFYHDGNDIATNGERYNSTLLIGQRNYTISFDVNNVTRAAFGDYVGTIAVDSYGLYAADDHEQCRSYYSYLIRLNFLYHFDPIPVSLIHFIIDVYEPPYILLLSDKRSIASTTLETALLSCRAINGNPNYHNLTLIKNNTTLIRGHGTDISYNTSTTNQFGSYTCVVESLYTTSEVTLLLKEKAYFLLSMEFDNSEQCREWKSQQGVTFLLEEIRNLLSKACNCDIATEDFEDSMMDCTSFQFSSSLVYSDTQGRVTASTLINILVLMITTSFTLEGTLYTTSCALLGNISTRVCVGTPVSAMPDGIGVYSNTVTGTYFGGLFTGILLCVCVVCIGMCILKFRTRRADTPAPTNENKGDVELSMNQAYETHAVNVRYQSRQQAQNSNVQGEPVYEIPAV